jgi:uncharacterized membrane protein YoaK (UPF0700 family)
MSNGELHRKNFQSARAASMTMANLLYTMLIPIIVFLGVISVTLWWRSYFWAPMYIHLLAGLSILVASLLVWMAWVVDNPLKGRVIWLVVIFPALMYLTFGFYGGVIISKHLMTRDKLED